MRTRTDQLVLVVENDLSLAQSILTVLETDGFDAIVCSSIVEAKAAFSEREIPIVLCDLKLDDGEGIEFIRWVREQFHDTNSILMTAHASVAVALEAINAGAFDVLSKPFSHDQLLICLAKLQQHQEVILENQELKQAVLDKTFSFSGIISQSPALLEVFETVKRLSSYTTTVLITGESGTGKELLARALHYNSTRKTKPFVAINCGAIPESLMESELFGHKKGAFTDATRDKKGLFEEADGGTLFLDEIGEMSPHLQVKLLRALQQKTIRRVGDEQDLQIDTRIIAATLKNLEDDVADGRFREDLFYRLNVVALHLPALRERKEDIPSLVDHLLTKHAKKLALPQKRVSQSALVKLNEYHWPGNIRELENYLERAALLSKGEEIEVLDLPEQVRSFNVSYDDTDVIAGDTLSLKEHSRFLETRLIKEALVRTKGNRTHASKLLDISHRALLYKLKEYHLSGFLKEQDTYE